MIDIEKIADGANMIVNGYAFTAKGEIVRVINLNNPASAAVIDAKDEIIETTMEDVELDIVADIYRRNKIYMGVDIA